MIPHNRPLVTYSDRFAVNQVLKSPYLSQGDKVERLESSFNQLYGGMGSSCAVSSGTSALYLALKCLGVDSGSTVILPTYSCSALLNAVALIGATPKVVDVLPDSFCIDPTSLTNLSGVATCVIAVHTYGAIADVKSIRKTGLKTIEDCCHSLGGYDLNGSLGNYGDVSIFSFYATKIITGGQGGLVRSSRTKLIETIRDYRQFDCRETWVPRFNFQMTDIQASMIHSQFKRLRYIRERRFMIAQRYLAVLPDGLLVQSGLEETGRMVYRFVILAPNKIIRDALHRHMSTAGITCSIPIQRYELLHRYLNLQPSAYPVAELIADTSLSIPVYPGLTDEEVSIIELALNNFKL